MSLIRLPSRSLGLPQSRLFVRRDYNVRALINVGSGFLDLVSGRPCTLTGAVQRTVGPAGRRFHSASSLIYAESPTGIANGTPLTLLVVSTSTSGSSVAAISDARGTWSCPRIDSTSGVITAYCKVSGGTLLSITGPTVTVGKTYVVAAHWRPGVGLKASFDGGAVQSSSHSATTLHVAPSTLWMGSGTGSNVYLLAALAGDLSDADLCALSKNPWSLLDGEDHLLWWPSASGGGDTTITCTVANAVASGVSAAVNLSLVTTPANAVASGATAAVNLSLATTPANAVAAGTTAAVNLSLVTTPANAVASGVSAAVNLSLATTPANAVASGISASLNGSVTVYTTPANAVASGVTALITGPVSVICAVGAAVAAGVTCIVTGGSTSEVDVVYLRSALTRTVNLQSAIG